MNEQKTRQYLSWRFSSVNASEEINERTSCCFSPEDYNRSVANFKAAKIENYGIISSI